MLITIPQDKLNAIREIYAKLKDTQINWVLTGSFSFALQNVPVTTINDIDIQTDEKGAYDIEKLFPDYIMRKVESSTSEKIQSHFGEFEVEGVKIEICGDIQKKLPDGSWEEPVDLNKYKIYVEFENMKIPVLPLKYEYEAYLKLGRKKQAELILNTIRKNNPDIFSKETEK